MSAHFDESQLLDLIEGELDSADAAALRGRLADDPQTLATLARLESDRQMLRALPEPELPQGFKAQIENLLARPMLIETDRPGVYRRQQRRIARQRKLHRLASAAIIALSISGGVWAAATFLLPVVAKQINASRQGLARNDKPSSPSAKATEDALPQPSASVTASNQISAAEFNAIVKSDDTVHHYLPQPVPTDKFQSDQLGQPARPEAIARNESVPSEQITADFEVVITTNDASRSEKSMAGLVGEIGGRSALVRNFSYAQARKLEAEWRVAEASKRNAADMPSPAVANAGKDEPGKQRHPMSTLAQRVRQQIDKAATVEPNQNTEISGRIAGSPESVPSLEEQLGLSSRGATHTVAVPARQLIDVLGRLGQIPNHSTTLRMLPPADADGQPAAATPPALSSWMQDGPRIRASLESLLHDHPDAIVLVPMIVVDQKAK